MPEETSVGSAVVVDHLAIANFILHGHSGTRLLSLLGDDVTRRESLAGAIAGIRDTCNLLFSEASRVLTQSFESINSTHIADSEPLRWSLQRPNATIERLCFIPRHTPHGTSNLLLALFRDGETSAVLLFSRAYQFFDAVFYKDSLLAVLVTSLTNGARLHLLDCDSLAFRPVSGAKILEGACHGC